MLIAIDDEVELVKNGAGKTKRITQLKLASLPPPFSDFHFHSCLLYDTVIASSLTVLVVRHSRLVS